MKFMEALFKKINEQLVMKLDTKTYRNDKKMTTTNKHYKKKTCVNMSHWIQTDFISII